MLGGLWHSAQATARCEPSNGKRVCAWSNFDRSFHSFVEWHASQPSGFPEAPACSHAVLELALVHILVAGGTAELCEMVRYYFRTE